ncbi:MAG TPA: HepT-like ribonuclease domain-containing protein [Bryobacteraceae bacterium]|nr:HepT-like ribonuclease domain-containing protein [Bryobacteraceae bacterium]
MPCANMISMRNRLIHAYFDVDLDIVRTTVVHDLPALLPVLEAAVAQIDPP